MQFSGKTGVRTLIVALALWVGGATGAAADDGALEPFYGVWIGSAVAESKTDTGTKVTARELYASILPDDDGFTMEWAAIRRRGVSDEPAAIQMQLAQFARTSRQNVWRSEPSEDPLEGVYAYARLEDGTLSVYNIGVNDAGVLETQIYRRAIVDGEMQLDYLRVVDGSLVREVKGTLAKSGE